MSKILYLLHIPPPVHGSAIVGMQIFNNQCLTDKYDSDFINISTSTSINEIGKKSIGKILLFFILLRNIFLNLIKNKYDCVYIALTVKPKALYKDYIFFLLCKLFCKKIIIHQHNKGVLKYQDSIVNYCIYKHIYNNSHVILLSERLKNEIESYVKPENISICPNGILVKTVAQIKHTNKKIKFLFLSNMIVNKGVIVLLDACTQLYSKGFDFECDFIGAPSSQLSAADIEREIFMRGLQNNVYYHGPIYDKKKCEFFQNADIFILPSFDECFPLVILEAMAYSLPIISTNVGGIPDIVINKLNGLIIEPNNQLQLENAMNELLTNKESISVLGRNSRRLYEESYTEDLFNERFVNVINDVLNK